ncbi:hypothetical protein K435DRAFT_816566 [Dendrothele bispora CBS 962.96]|uniref:Uncharacterized protein n=1 Tax=Dendrothele bispora (strain CBS 962.96) TaxID=1314807 RepID=A0A4S8MQI6_DENBC|nr:hypothetical protein K435DRAFT_816566 [Dendrothele bispora CBS 962.96]
MGGNAFHFLDEDAFPRLPPAVYQRLKSRLFSVIQTLYSHVTVPIEAPEKNEYGDLDFLVFSPKPEAFSSTAERSINVPHEVVKEAIGAHHFIPADGNRTSNFAVPISRGEWSTLGFEREELEVRKKVKDDGEIYYQVDVHVCADKKEWDRIYFYNSYGDLGMIMGLIASNAGLQLGSKGLHYSYPPHPRLLLSDDFDKITRFFGWSMETRNAGFKTRKEIFEWVMTSRFFDPARFRTQGDGIRKVKAQRTMYSDFVECANNLQRASPSPTSERRESTGTTTSARDEALEYFGKKQEVETQICEYGARKRMKDVFNGNTVRSWMLASNWKDVKDTMDSVRARYGGDEGVMKLLEAEGEEVLQKRVLEAFEKLKMEDSTPISISNDTFAFRSEPITISEVVLQ